MVQIAPPKTNNVQLGDFVGKAGIYTNPGVVVEKREDGTVMIDTDKETISKYHRHTNTSGLSLEEKERFNTIMDDIMKADSNEARINQMQLTIDTLQTDPTNRKVVETLRNEQATLIRHAKELPRVYNYDPNKLR